MTPDAALLTIEQIRFRKPWPVFGYGYAIAVAADNHGHIYISEFPSTKKIRHRPIRNRPACWDFGYEGFSVYQKTGGLPDLMRFWVAVVRDRRATRKAGELLAKLKNDANFAKVQATATALAASNPTAALMMPLVSPVIGILGGILEESKDRILDTLEGTVMFDTTLKQEMGRSDEITSSELTAVLDLDLFSAEADEGSVASLQGVTTRWIEDGSLVLVAP